MTHSDVDVVVPSWNGRHLLERGLPALVGQVTPEHLVVVDNGSSDGTVELLAGIFPRVRVVSLPEPAGFARPVNRGIEAGRAPYVVVLNNDVECDAGFVGRLVAPLRRDGTVGMVAAVLVRPGRATVDDYGLELDRTLSAFPRFRGRPYPSTRLDDRYLLGPSGGAAAYRRAALEQVGSFDEKIVAYHEDADLALRLRARGWSCAGASDAVGVHLGSATIGARSRWQVETAGASRAYLLRKYGILRSDPPTALWALAVEAGVVAAECVAGRDLAAVRGRVRGWRAAGRAARTSVPPGAVNPHIGLREALRRRAAVLSPPASVARP